MYGDDLTTEGPKMHLDWLKERLEEHYELVESARLGPGSQDDKHARVLNRVVRWTEEGLEYEADPRQSEKLVRDLKLEGSKAVSTPGVKATQQQMDEDEPLDHAKHGPYRAVAARANYLSADRPETQHSAKEACRWMSSPTQLALTALKRLGRFIEGKPRLIFKYKWQSASVIDVYSDTDWAGCPKTRKSTSGGCIMLGTHLIKSWSSTQQLVALSSGEAEYYGVVKGAGVGLGYQALLTDIGLKLRLRAWTDSSASIGICRRQGLGKLRHIDTQTLWIQQRVRDASLELRKVKGTENPGDLFTKHLVGAEKIEQLLQLFGCSFSSGRPENAPAMREAVGTSKGELLTVTDEIEQLPEELRVTWQGRCFPRAEGYDDLPDAHTSRRGLLPHLHADLDSRFPRAEFPADEENEPQEPEDWLEQRGQKIGKRANDNQMH